MRGFFYFKRKKKAEWKLTRYWKKTTSTQLNGARITVAREDINQAISNH